MIEIINSSTDPYFNLALEEYTVMSMPDQSSYFILWQNQPTVVVGKNQNTIEEINKAFIAEKGIKVVRRMSGGGAVYHDGGNLNFTFVVNENRDFSNFSKFTRPVIKALQRIGIEAENNGRNDITIEGKKFSGNAQFRYHNRLLHHGTILFDSCIEDMVEALNVSEMKISSKGIKSVRSRVTNIKEHLSSPVTIQEFKKILTETVLAEEEEQMAYPLTDKDIQTVNDLRNNKYATWDWVYGTSPMFNIRRTGKFEWGNVDVRLEVRKGIISGCRIFGDYFAQREIAELENVIIGVSYRREDVKGLMKKINIKDYLPLAEEEEIIDLLCE